MMRLNFSILDEPLTIEGATILAIKDVRVFAHLIQSLYQFEEDGDVKFYDSNFKSLKASELLLVTDIMTFEVNTPAVIKKIHADLERQFNDKPEVKLEIERLCGMITHIIASECLESELDLTYDELSLLTLLKSLGVKVDSQTTTLSEKMFEILQIFKYLTSKRLLICINTLSYFQTEEIKNIIEYIQLSQLPVLFLEPSPLKEFSHYVLDDDFYLDSNIKS